MVSTELFFPLLSLWLVLLLFPLLSPFEGAGEGTSVILLLSPGRFFSRAAGGAANANKGAAAACFVKGARGAGGLPHRPTAPAGGPARSPRPAGRGGREGTALPAAVVVVEPSPQ